jgi:general secretion pathway protein F
MPVFHYRALDPNGVAKSGEISAADAEAAADALEQSGLSPIEAPSAGSRPSARGWLRLFGGPSAEDVTIFTADLALLLRTGARINDALELIAADAPAGALRPLIEQLARSVLSGESFAEAIARRPDAFPPIYAALTRVGEASGSLAPLLEAIARERQRSETLKRSVYDALRYPAFLLLGAAGVLLFFLLAVLPQFAGVFRDFHAQLDPMLVMFLTLSDGLRAHSDEAMIAAAVVISGVWFAARQRATRATFAAVASRLPFVGAVIEYRSAALFCRNLGLLLSSGVALPESLRILAVMSALGRAAAAGPALVDRVRQGGRLSDALAATQALPALAIRTLKLGESSGRLPELSQRLADFYEAKLQRALSRIVGVIGPAAIIVISLIVGGLIVSVMTALLSVNQIAG